MTKLIPKEIGKTPFDKTKLHPNHQLNVSVLEQDIGGNKDSSDAS